MNVHKISNKITIRPTNKKMREAKQAVISSVSGLPKEVPVEKKIYIQPFSESFERIKDSIQIAIENMKGQK